MKKRKKKFDIREEYYVSVTTCILGFVVFSRFVQRLQAKPDEDWEVKRIERPEGVPEWGVPPAEPPERK